MREWEAIETADAMELLSPDFRNEEVRRPGGRRAATATLLHLRRLTESNLLLGLRKER